jgi:hypothetical protein
MLGSKIWFRVGRLPPPGLQRFLCGLGLVL